MTSRTCLSIILAAGEGTRMKSPLPKVLHRLAGLPLIGHVAKAATMAGGDNISAVIGHGAERVRKEIARLLPDAEIFVQELRLGTGHAVLAARATIERGFDDLLVMFGDTPLIDPATLSEARNKLAEGHAVVVVGFRAQNPTGYGRLIEDGRMLAAIREEKDCSEAERKIDFCNGGLMAISGEIALSLLDAIGTDNAKGEFYLTDIVEIARGRDLAVTAIEASAESLLGVNTLAELAEAEAVWQQKRRRQLMLSGVAMLAPETVYLAHDTQIAAGVTIEPGVFFGPGVSVAAEATIHAFSHIEGARIGAGSHVGPFARLRPGADLADNAKVGNFCEVKQATIGAGAKVNHLSYIGDARIGADANIGAGTITCNYDGFSKFITEIGPRAFVGSNTALVAPVSVGAGAYVASGSVITDGVPEDALAFGRARQKTLPGRGRELRERLAAAKAAKT